MPRWLRLFYAGLAAMLATQLPWNILARHDIVGGGVVLGIAVFFALVAVMPEKPNP